MRSTRCHLAVAALLATAALLRLWGLAWLPSPAGDEGHFASFGHLILRGETAEYDPRAAYISMLYGHLIAVSMRVFGLGFFAARFVNVAAVLGAMVGAYLLMRRLGSPGGGLVLAALLGLHPWLLAYSRICSSPYPLALVSLLLGCLAFLVGLGERRAGFVFVAIQILAIGGHFSPLTIIGPAACVTYCLARPHRWVFRHWATYVSAALAALHVWPVVGSAIGVAQQSPQLDQFSHFWSKLGQYLHMVGTGLGGEATLRHFSNLALSPWWALLVAVPVLGFVAVAASGSCRRSTPLAGFGVLYVALGLVLTPLILAPSREWYCPANHQDRYLLALIPGFFICVAGAASLRGRWIRTSIILFVGWLGLGGGGRLTWAYLFSHGVDHGELVFDGGSGYRGWLVSESPVSTMAQIRELALRQLGPAGGAVLVADRTFIPLPLFMEDTGIPVYDVRRTWIPPHPRARYLVVLWPDQVMSVGNPPTAPRKYLESNRLLRDRMSSKFERVQLVKLLRQRDGAPLLEIWRAEMPRPKRLQPPRATVGVTHP